MEWLYSSINEIKNLTADNTLDEKDKLKVMDDIGYHTDDICYHSDDGDDVDGDDVENINLTLNMISDDIINLQLHFKCMESIHMIQYKKLQNITTYCKYNIIMLGWVNVMLILYAIVSS